MKFYKYQGAGNDFLIADNRDASVWEKDGVLYSGQWSSPISALCDRRYGIGADGLMLLESCEDADFRMTYFNSDGSGGMMCGNGGRCIVAFASDRGIGHFDFIAADGFHTAQILSSQDRVNSQVCTPTRKDAFLTQERAIMCVLYKESMNMMSLRKAAT